MYTPMKLKRYQIRENAFMLLFESLFSQEEPEEILLLAEESGALEVTPEVRDLFLKTCEKKSEIDKNIAENLSNKWSIARISKISLSILRVAVYELCYEKGLAVSFVINEAVELGKAYSTPEDAAFINGVLGAVSRRLSRTEACAAESRKDTEAGEETAKTHLE